MRAIITYILIICLSLAKGFGMTAKASQPWIQVKDGTALHISNTISNDDATALLLQDYIAEDNDDNDEDPCNGFKKINTAANTASTLVNVTSAAASPAYTAFIKHFAYNAVSIYIFQGVIKI